MSTVGVRQILVALDARPESLAAVERTAVLAAELGAELSALFVEDVELLRMCQLPVVEVSLRGGVLRRPERATIERELRARAAEARRAIERAAGRRQVAWTFRTTRGRVHEEALRTAPEAHFVTAAGRTGATAGRMRRAPRAPVIAAVLGAGEPGERALALAAAIARARGARLLVLAPPDAATGAAGAARIASIAGADVRITAIAIACDGDAPALAAALAALDADLVVLPGATPGLTPSMLEHLRTAAGCDLIVLGAARPAAGAGRAAAGPTHRTVSEHMNEDDTLAAARAVWAHWRAGTVMDSLEAGLRPRSLADGYRIQARLAEAAGERPVGWKIAATAAAGQAHLAVDGPIAGRLLAGRVQPAPATLDVARNGFRLAEAEFAFVLARDLPPRAAPYRREEVVAAVASLHPAIELPDSRFADPTVAGSAQLAADDACADLFVLGAAAPDGWRALDLAAHALRLDIDGETVTRGSGADVLGDPRDALTWLANQHELLGTGLEAGQIVTTGVCGQPAPYRPGQRLLADFGALGAVRADLLL